jgi:hypothetical protein
LTPFDETLSAPLQSEESFFSLLTSFASLAGKAGEKEQQERSFSIYK